MATRNPATTQYGCAVLAGGAGSRMGGVNKALLPAGQSVSAIRDVAQAAIAGEGAPETILERTARILDGTGMPCCLSVAAYEQDVPDGWTVVPDADYLQGLCSLPDEKGGAVAGPLGGIYACLCRAAEEGIDGLFFVPCDAPHYEADVIEKMLPHIGADGEKPEDGAPADAVIWTTADGRQQVAFGWYSVSCLPVLHRQLAGGHYKVREALAKLQVKELRAAEEGVPEERFRNLNTPDDLEKR